MPWSILIQRRIRFEAQPSLALCGVGLSWVCHVLVLVSVSILSLLLLSLSFLSVLPTGAFLNSHGAAFEERSRCGLARLSDGHSGST